MEPFCFFHNKYKWCQQPMTEKCLSIYVDPITKRITFQDTNTLSVHPPQFAKAKTDGTI